MLLLQRTQLQSLGPCTLLPCCAAPLPPRTRTATRRRSGCCGCLGRTAPPTAPVPDHEGQCASRRCRTTARTFSSSTDTGAAAEAAAAPGLLAEGQELLSPGPQLLSERGVTFTSGTAFYRPESAQGRDLAVLAAAVHRARTGRLHVLDVMSGSGVRGARYIQQAGAEYVWCNDFNPTNTPALVYNLCTAASGSCPDGPPGPSAHSHWMQQAEPFQYPGLKRSSWRWSFTQPTTNQPLNHLPTATQPIPTDTQPISTDSTAAPAPPGGEGAQGEGEGEGPAAPPRGVNVHVSCMDGHRLLSAVGLAEEYFDLVDVDSFGSETAFLGAALEAVRFGGLLYLTSTDGFCSAGHRPVRSLAAYGAYLRSMPFSNEQGLRMLIGAAVKEGAARGMVVLPVFSLYSYHGPVFRVMLRVTRGAEWAHGQYGFLGHCHVHGDTRAVDWRSLGGAMCRCCASPKRAAVGTSGTSGAEQDGGTAAPGAPPVPLTLSGPMWTGPLHCLEELRAMRDEAAARGWLDPEPRRYKPTAGGTTSGTAGGTADGATAAASGQLPPPPPTKKNAPLALSVLLEVLLEEAEEKLVPGYLTLDTIGQHLACHPSRDKLIAALRREGFAAARCHVDSRALRTSACMQQVLRTCLLVLGLKLRPASPFLPLLAPDSGSTGAAAQ